LRYGSCRESRTCQHRGHSVRQSVPAIAHRSSSPEGQLVTCSMYFATARRVSGSR
jgi:hypothetical protein